MDPWVCVLAAGFDDQDPARRIGAQPVRQNATGRTGADNDKIVFRIELHLPDRPLGPAHLSREMRRRARA
jgi:hypothetical protein